MKYLIICIITVFTLGLLVYLTNTNIIIINKWITIQIP